MKRGLQITILTISLILNGVFGYFIWTNRIDETPIFDPFEINYNVTEKSLLKEGYTPIPEDVPLLGKQIGDTLIYYQMNEECGELTEEGVDCEI